MLDLAAALAVGTVRSLSPFTGSNRHPAETLSVRLKLTDSQVPGSFTWGGDTSYIQLSSLPLAWESESLAIDLCCQTTAS